MALKNKKYLLQARLHNPASLLLLVGLELQAVEVDGRLDTKRCLGDALKERVLDLDLQISTLALDDWQLRQSLQEPVKRVVDQLVRIEESLFIRPLFFLFEKDLL